MNNQRCFEECIHRIGACCARGQLSFHQIVHCPCLGHQMEMKFAPLKEMGYTLVNPWKEVTSRNHESETWSWAHQLMEQIFQTVVIQGRLTKARWANFASGHHRRSAERWTSC